MFINLSNHSVQKWGSEQKQAALKYGEVMDMEFPGIDPDWSESKVRALAEEYAERIIRMNPACVLCQGEFCFTYALVYRLLEKGISVVAAVSERKVKESFDKEKGIVMKQVEFDFAGFRFYGV